MSPPRQEIAAPSVGDCNGPIKPASSENTNSDLNVEHEAHVQVCLDDKDRWLQSCDLERFREEIEELGKQLAEGQGVEDVRHLRKMMIWNRTLQIIGLVTLGLFPNPLTVICLSLATFSRWTMIGHHVCHGGYDKADKTGRFHRFRFAVGSFYRRLVDWLDWMLPEAWNIEHNKFHHYNLNEDTDPDLVEANLVELREKQIPLFLKYLAVGFFMLTWKWFYYAPNTFSQLQLEEGRRRGEVYPMEDGERSYLTILSVFHAPKWLSVTSLFLRALLPYFVFQFVMTPLPLLLFFGIERYSYGIVNLILAELLTNVHSFIAIVTNHAGDDLYRFDTKCQARSEHFYLRQVIGSVDFATGSDLNDFMHGFLNYQIEHHLWPALSMLSYQRAQPKVKAICEKYNIPYVQENVFLRLKKTIDIMVGSANMRRFPQEFNPSLHDVDEQIEETVKDKSE